MAVTFYFARHGETQFNVVGKVQGWSDSPLSPRGIYSAYKLGNGLADVSFVGACASDSQRAQDTLSIALEARGNERARLRNGRAFISHEVLLDNQTAFPNLDEFGDMDEIAALEEFLRSRGCLDPQSAVPDTSDEPTVEQQWLVKAEGWRPSIDQLEGLDYPAYGLAVRGREAHPEPPVPVRIDTRLREWCFGDLEGQPMVKLRNRLYDLFGEDLPREQQNKRIDEIANYLHRADKTHRAENFAAISTRVASFLDDCGAAVERHGGGNVLVVTHAMFIRALVFMFSDELEDDPSRIENASITKVVWDAGAITVRSVSDTSHLQLAKARRQEEASPRDETALLEEAAPSEITEVAEVVEVVTAPEALEGAEAPAPATPEHPTVSPAA